MTGIRCEFRIRVVADAGHLALSQSFRYQLTIVGPVVAQAIVWKEIVRFTINSPTSLVGRQAWGAQAVVWQKIRQNRFVIRSKPGVEVS